MKPTLPPVVPNRDKPWLKQPGELRDCKGRPIYPGDLLKTPHFHTKCRKYWLYGVAVYQDGAMYWVGAAEMEPTKRGQGGFCLLSDATTTQAEIISGHGPGEILDFRDRPRRKTNECGQ